QARRFRLRIAAELDPTPRFHFGKQQALERRLLGVQIRRLAALQAVLELQAVGHHGMDQAGDFLVHKAGVLRRKETSEYYRRWDLGSTGGNGIGVWVGYDGACEADGPIVLSVCANRRNGSPLRAEWPASQKGWP